MRINIVPLKDEERKRLILRLRSGDQEAIEPIIKSYVPLAHKIAKGYHVRYPYLCEEITASAMWGLVRSVTRVADGNLKQGVDIEGYLTPFIKSEIRDFIIKDFPVVLTRWALEHTDERPSFIRTESKLGKEIPFRDFRERYDTVEDMIQEVGYDDRERKIIESRLDGLTMEEIGKVLDVSTGRIQQLLARIQKKWKDYNVNR